jgi:hypothetical protein
MSFESMKKYTKIEKDKTGGYSEHQKDYKARMRNRDRGERKGGYYESGYHNKSPEFKQGEYQFVRSGKKPHSKKKK